MIMEERLAQMGAWLDVNGEAIYASRTYAQAKNPGVYYTQKPDAVYAIIENYPWGEIELDEVPYRENMKVSLLGCNAEIKAADCGGHVKLIIPPINPENMKSEYLYTFKIEKE